MMTFRPNVFRTLSSAGLFAGLVLLSACPQMTTGAINGAGSPLNASGEKSSSNTSDTTEKSAGSDELAPPPAAPPTAVGGGDAGGLGGAGSGNSDYETAMRRLPAPTGEPTPVSGPIASRDSAGGVLSAPSSPEYIGSQAVNLRAIYIPSGQTRNWTDANDFFQKLSAGEISETVARHAKAMHWMIMISRFEEDGIPQTVANYGEILTNDIVQEPGTYFFFYTENYNAWEMGPQTMDIASLSQLKSLIAVDQVDDDGFAFKLHFFGERSVAGTLMPMIKIDPSLLKQALPSVLPSHPLQKPSLLPSR
jgi:hypothetical protein